MNKFLRFIAIGLVVSLSACATKKDRFAGVDGDYVMGTPLGDRVDGSSFFSDNVVKGQFSPVYFGYDSFEVSSAEMTKVRQVAAAMKQMKNSIIIAGFTDDRGTEEYNRGLGEKRALAVRQAIIDQGIAAGRIQTVSFGEEMPADPGSGETAWGLNRRAEFGVIK